MLCLENPPGKEGMANSLENTLRARLKSVNSKFSMYQPIVNGPGSERARPRSDIWNRNRRTAERIVMKHHLFRYRTF